MFCNVDYPQFISELSKKELYKSYETNTGIAVGTETAYGGWMYKMYCDGSAATIAVASVAVAAASVSIY